MRKIGADKREEVDIGYKIGRLTIIQDLGMILPKETSKVKKRFYLCRCECGNEKRVVRSAILNKLTLSCGCLQKENGEKRMKTLSEQIKNGTVVPFSKYEKEFNSKSRLYNIWQNMKARCTNENNERYQDYGGRGIKICDDWNDYQNFIDFAKNNGYTELLSLDRIDVDGNYEPSNCRWATDEEQAKNKRTSLVVIVTGKQIGRAHV